MPFCWLLYTWLLFMPSSLGYDFLTDVKRGTNSVQLRTGEEVDIWRQSVKHNGRHYVWIHLHNVTYLGVYQPGDTLTLFRRLRGKGYNR